MICNMQMLGTVWVADATVDLRHVLSAESAYGVTLSRNESLEMLKQPLHTHIHTQTHARTHRYTNTNTAKTHTHTQSQTDTHTHTHTQTHTHLYLLQGHLIRPGKVGNYWPIELLLQYRVCVGIKPRNTKVNMAEQGLITLIYQWRN